LGNIALMKIKKTVLIQFLFVTVFFVAFHSALHNQFDHQHDSSCSVYVLEQFFVGADAVIPLLVFTLFTPFVFILYHRSVYKLEVQKTFNNRAPPLL